MTIPITLTNLVNLANPTTAVTTINSNNTAIASAFSTAYNTTGDQLLGTMDANSNQIINLPAPGTTNSPARLIDVVSNPTITIPSFTTPTGSVGLTAVAGTASTTVRSDSAPVINQGIAPTWTGAHTFSSAITATGTATIATIAATTITANTVAFTTETAKTSTITVLNASSITGVTSYPTAGSGFVGEFITSTGSSVGMTSATPTVVTTVSLGAGLWLVGGGVAFSFGGTATTFNAGIFTNSASFSTAAQLGQYISLVGPAFSTISQFNMGPYAYSTTTAATVYLNVQNTFSSSCTASGTINAWRIH